MMVDKDSTAATRAPTKVIRDVDFARRLDKAVSGHSRAPVGHGRQKWLRDEMAQKFEDKLSPEAVRKWFAGESRPRPKVMSKLAQVLEVDEAWLSLGINPTQTPVDKKRHNALASGATNIAAGLIQLAGGNIAYSNADKGYDFMAIIGGKSYAVEVKYLSQGKDKAKIALGPNGDFDRLAIIVTGDSANYKGITFYRLTDEVIEKHGSHKGGFVEIDLNLAGNLSAGEDDLPIIKDFAKLNGELPRKRKAEAMSV